VAVIQGNALGASVSPVRLRDLRVSRRPSWFSEPRISSWPSC